MIRRWFTYQSAVWSCASGQVAGKPKGGHRQWVIASQHSPQSLAIEILLAIGSWPIASANHHSQADIGKITASESALSMFPKGEQ
jgi:hypothetical protein